MRLKCPSVVSCSMPNMKPATNTKPKSLPGSAHTCRLQLQTVIALARSRGGLGTVSGLRRRLTGITCPAGSSLAAWNNWLSFPELLKSLSEGLTATIINNNGIVKNSQTQFNDHCVCFQLPGCTKRQRLCPRAAPQLGLTLDEISDLHRFTS